VELYLHSPNMPSWRNAELKHRDNFTFTMKTYMYSGSGGIATHILNLDIR
jgi:hypothetical protein